MDGELLIRSFPALTEFAWASQAAGDIVYHVVLGGMAMVTDPDGGPPQRLEAGDMLMVPTGAPHTLHDGGGAKPLKATQRVGVNLTVSENAGTGERLDMLCGRFTIAPPHDRLLGARLRSRPIVRGTPPSPTAAQTGARDQLAGLVALMRAETGMEGLGGHSLLNAFSAALFALAFRLASESDEVPPGLLALAAHCRIKL